MEVSHRSRHLTISDPPEEETESVKFCISISVSIIYHSTNQMQSSFYGTRVYEGGIIHRHEAYSRTSTLTALFRLIQISFAITNISGQLENEGTD
jgi:hypothetical protein